MPFAQRIREATNDLAAAITQRDAAITKRDVKISSLYGELWKLDDDKLDLASAKPPSSFTHRQCHAAEGPAEASSATEVLRLQLTMKMLLRKIDLLTRQIDSLEQDVEFRTESTQRLHAILSRQNELLTSIETEKEELRKQLMQEKSLNRAKTGVIESLKRCIFHPFETTSNKVMPLPDALMKTRNKCVVCQDAERTHMYYPCGHYCVCESCCKQCNNRCPLCHRDAGACKVFFEGV